MVEQNAAVRKDIESGQRTTLYKFVLECTSQQQQQCYRRRQVAVIWAAPPKNFLFCKLTAWLTGTLACSLAEGYLSQDHEIKVKHIELLLSNICARLGFAKLLLFSDGGVSRGLREIRTPDIKILKLYYMVGIKRTSSRAFTWFYSEWEWEWCHWCCRWWQHLADGARNGNGGGAERR